MSYAKIDDLLPHHPKLIEAGGDAATVFGIYVASICFAQRQRTDGFIPKKALALLLPSQPRPAKRYLTLLVKLRLWDEAPDGWRIHDYLDHNDSASTRQSKARVAATARWHPDEHAARHALGYARGNANSNASGIDRAVQPECLSSPLLSTPLHSTPLLSAGDAHRIQGASDRASEEARGSREAFQRLTAEISERMGFRP